MSEGVPMIPCCAMFGFDTNNKHPAMCQSIGHGSSRYTHTHTHTPGQELFINVRVAVVQGQLIAAAVRLKG